MLLAVGTIVMVGFVSLTNVFQGRFGFRQKQNTVSGQAEAGIELATSDLNSRVRNGDWLTFTDSANNITTDQGRYDSGLIYPPSGATRTSKNHRFSISNGDLNSKVYYFPDAANIGATLSTYPDTYPKFYHVIIQTQNTKTGQTYSTETKLRLDKKPVSDFALALFTSATPAPGTFYEYPPGSYSGHVHFGSMNPTNVSFVSPFKHPSSAAYPPSNVVKFEGRVTTGYDASGSTAYATYPFTKSPDVVITPGPAMEDAYEVSVGDSAGDTTSWFNTVKSKAILLAGGSGTTVSTRLQSADATVEADATTADICLLFKPTTIEIYTCNASNIPSTRYTGTATVINSPSQVFYCESCQYHIKGIVGGTVAVISKNRMYIEGDIQYADQSSTSANFFSAITQHDLYVGPAVPSYDVPYFTSSTTLTSSVSSTSHTNFTVTNDRDMGDTNYLNPVSGQAQNNAQGTLDLDGVYYTDGLFRIRGINDADPLASTTKGVSFGISLYNTTDGTRYSHTTTGGNPWFSATNVKNAAYSAVVPLMAVTMPSSTSTPPGTELPRQYSYAVWVFGSLTSRTHGKLMTSGLGFTNQTINWDTRLELADLFGVPLTNQPKIQTVWKKSSDQKSTFLTAQGVVQ